MKILAIDTSCDETAAAVVEDGKVLSNVVWSQIKLHKKWGGVVPNLARRAHEIRLPAVVAEALRMANSPNLPNLPNWVSAVAVTIGPGLAPALEVGIKYAKELALKNNLPLIPVNHLEGHMASVFLRKKTGRRYSPNSPNLANSANSVLNLIVSGGHTELVNSKFQISNSKITARHLLLGETLDDAAGECLDKVGRELGLGYPAGPVVEKMAKRANLANLPNSPNSPNLINLPIPMQTSPKTDLNFSFSGLKSAAVRLLRDLGDLSSLQITEFCFILQKTVTEAILLKLRRAVIQTGVKEVVLSGGVATNNYLRRHFLLEMKKLGGTGYLPAKKFTGDNAAMIGLAAAWAWDRGEAARDREGIMKVDRIPNLNFQFSIFNFQ